MTKPRAVRVLSDDGKSNLSAEAWMAFNDELESVFQRDRRVPLVGRLWPRFTRTLTVRTTRLELEANVEDAEGEGVAAPDPGPPGPTLNRRQVEAMLTDEAAWKLAMRNGDKHEILDKGTLAEKWRTADSFTPTVSTRQPQGGEPTVLKWQDDDLGADAGQIDKAVALPVTAVATVATLLGGYGLLGTDNVHKPWLLAIAILLSLVAAGLAWRPTVDLETQTLRPGHLEEAELRYGRSLHKGVRGAWIPLAVLGVSAVLALLAIVLPDSPSTSPKIAVADAGQTSEGVQAQVNVEWDALPEGATGVQSTVTGADGTQVAFRRTDKAPDGGAKQDFPVKIPQPGEIEVHARAVNAKGTRVGVESVESFKVP
jgi:hypothetical protein